MKNYLTVNSKYGIISLQSRKENMISMNKAIEIVFKALKEAESNVNNETVDMSYLSCNLNNKLITPIDELFKKGEYCEY